MSDDASDLAARFDAQPADGSVFAPGPGTAASTAASLGQFAADGSSLSPAIGPSVAAIAPGTPIIVDANPDGSGSPSLNSTFSPTGASPHQVQLALNAAGLSVTGAGITVGVISDSFNNLGGAAQDEADGALPSAAKVHVLKDIASGGTDEGRAMMQVVHDIAPDATLDFYTADVSEQDFANGIIALANAGAKVIVDDISYFDEPFFQSGVIANAIQTVEQEGVTYLTSAGNDAANAYQAAWTPISGTFDGISMTDAESFGGSVVQTITLGGNSSSDIPILIEWNQAYGAAPVDDLEVHVFSGGRQLGVITNVNSNPWIGFTVTGGATYQIAIVNPSGANPGLIKEVVSGDGLPVTISGANTGTVVGHHMSPFAITVGAVDSANTPAFGKSILNESFSSSGAGTELLFNSSGTPISPQFLSPVAVSGVDDIQTSVSGGLGDFFGTSAAAPSVAGVVADMLQANPNLTPSQIETILEQSATAFGNSAVSGAGLVNAAAAVQLALTFGAPTVTARNLQETSGEAPVAVSTLLTYSDPAAKPAVSWRIQDVASDGTSALLLNGLTLNAATTVTLTAAQFAQVAVGPVTSSHQIWVVASDGTSSSTPVNFTVAPPVGARQASGPPTVTPHNLQETSGGAPVALSTLLTYSDPSGISAATWRIADVASDGTSALLLNGVTLNASSTVVLTAAQFAQVAVGPVTSSHQIWASASDGTFSSSPVNFTVAPPAAPAPSGPPTVTPHNLSETSGEAPVALSALLTYSDPSGAPAVSWRVADVASDGTNALLLNGVTLNASSTVVLTAAQFAQLAVGPVTSSHQIWASASDGTFSSTAVNFTVTPPPGAGPPTVTPHNLQETGGGAPVALSALLTYSDPSGAPAVSWRIADVASDGTNALLLNGVALNAHSTVVLTAAQFAQLAVGPVTSSHQIWAVASDGTFSSSPVNLTVTPPGSTSGFADQDLADAALVFGDGGMAASPVVIADGGSAELVYSAAPVSFIGASGTLQLDNSAGFSGQVAGFSAQDQIDLRDIAFSPQTTIGYKPDSTQPIGNLTVGESGQTANLALLGNYAASEFATSSDGHGGTLVTLQPMSPAGSFSTAAPRNLT